VKAEESHHAKPQLDSTGRFDTIPACDGQTDGRKYRASLASRGKKKFVKAGHVPGWRDVCQRHDVTADIAQTVEQLRKRRHQHILS